MGENETLYSPGRVAASHSRRLWRALTHHLMDRISALSHKPCFPPVFFLTLPAPPDFLLPLVRGERRVIKVYAETKVAFISSHYAVSVAGIAGDLSQETGSPETMATAT